MNVPHTFVANTALDTEQEEKSTKKSQRHSQTKT